jgi:hypothetical protein
MNRLAIAMVLSLALMTAISAAGRRSKESTVRRAVASDDRAVTQRRIHAREALRELDEVDARTAMALTVTPRKNAIPEHRELFDLIPKDARELMEIDLSLRKLVGELDRRDLTERETADYSRLRKEWKRLDEKLQSDRHAYEAAIRPVVEAEVREYRIAEAKRLEKEDLGVTMKAYLKIQNRQTYYEVQRIIGWQTLGTEHSDIGSMKTFSWGERFPKIICTFENGHLVGKSQIGL